MSESPISQTDSKHSKQRRALLKGAVGMSVLGIASGLTLAVPGISYAAALTREERDKLTPDQIIAGMKEGNVRFRNGKMQQHDYLAQKRASAEGQFPAAVILSCIDSRAPAEIIFDTGIGETFNARVAGNVSNNDLLGSMEFACAAAGAKVVLVMGHTACGAVRGAIDGVELGHLTGLLNQIKPAIAKTEFSGERTGKNAQFVDAVAKSNVLHTIEEIRKQSEILRGLEKEGKIKIVGAMYNLNGGAVEFVS
ncbi:carbonic anhydrase [Yersinia enterocolitica]|uniref:Carbonic anhydrase n=1 Tax=Yersinia massiliensis TaxID=419257 RepID=A0ABM6UTX2_9GAMM|nr:MULTISPECIES: carbonic anhydrase [Yersinia]HEC1649995.1 carbonic anhydrase [Yersinia enterocolitica]ATM85657.1 carbonic anhydrase [Yersinia frederiksenii]AVX38427.1 carbonic anhydrase [Yersinia massiliensis]MCB5315891.1 carbonic anhydrase [Yersinia massiliensis]QKJ13208.1 carbonic anhydrase [Yersinia massiliensis]